MMAAVRTMHSVRLMQHAPSRFLRTGTSRARSARQTRATSEPSTQSPWQKTSSNLERELLTRGCLGILTSGLVATKVLGDVDSFESALERIEGLRRPDDILNYLSNMAQEVKQRVNKELQDENHKVIAGLIAANVAVFGLWRVSFRNPALNSFMQRHFACSYDGVVKHLRLHTLVTSPFSHVTVPHLVINSILLWELGTTLFQHDHTKRCWFCSLYRNSWLHKWIEPNPPPLDSMLGRFLLLCGTSGVASSAFGIVASRVRGNPSLLTVGSSGVISALVCLTGAVDTDRQLKLFNVWEPTAGDVVMWVLIATASDFVGALGGLVGGLASSVLIVKAHNERGRQD